MSLHQKQPVHVLILAGSLRRGSLNHWLAELAAQATAQVGATTDLARIAEFDCPLYDGDFEQDSGIPDGAQRLSTRLKAADAVLIASPGLQTTLCLVPMSTT